MDVRNQFFIPIFGYMKKIFVAKEGRVAILSTMLSLIPTACMLAYADSIETASVSILQVESQSQGSLAIAINALFQDVNLKYVFLPLLFELIAFFIFSTLTIINLFSGIQAAKALYIKEHGFEGLKTSDWLDKDKLWNTFWKYVSTLFVTTLIITLCICCEIGKYNWGYGISIWFLFMLWLLACGFEFISIGDNIESKTGKKPRIFSLYEVLIDKLSRKTIEKIETAKSQDLIHEEK